MHFSHDWIDDEEYKIVECVELDNNILLYKEKLDENESYVVKLKENQYAILFKKGQVFDIIKEQGVYTIKMEANNVTPEDFKDYIIKDNDDNLCILFLNGNIITNNKFYIKKKRKNNFYGEGTFDFQIDNPLKLLNKVVKVRNYYSREELLEQIRERITKIVIEVIKSKENEYIIDEEHVNSSVNIFNEYGIKIVNSSIKNIQFEKKQNQDFIKNKVFKNFNF